MNASNPFLGALETFLASEAFENVVYDHLARFTIIPPVVELHRNGAFTVYSRREDATFSPDTVVVEIPFGEIAEVRERLRRAFDSP